MDHKLFGPLDYQDKRHFDAAQGWLELGDCIQAKEEIEGITAEMRSHVAVLDLRWTIYSETQNWQLALDAARELVEIMPDICLGFVLSAIALHEMKRTREAWDVLWPVVGQFDEAIIPYNLACYACQLGMLREARDLVMRAFDLDNKNEFRKLLLQDPNLKPLWDNLGQI